MATPRQLLLVAHHRHTCGGLLPGMLEGLGQVRRVHPLDGEPLPDPGSVDGVVVLGSGHGVHDPIAGLDAEKQFLGDILARGTPMLGICFGAQLLALLHGATVRRGERGEYGARMLVPTGHPWLEDPMEVMHWHQDGIYNLPHQAIRFATAHGEYPEQAFALGSGVGLQFHPETTPDMLSRWLARSNGPHVSSPAADRLFQDLEGMSPMRHWLGIRVKELFG